MHSCHNKLLPNHFDEYFIPLSSIHHHSTRLATSRNLFLPRVNSSSGKCSLKFIGPKVWSSIPDDIRFSTTFTFKWKLKKHLVHEKNSQLWTSATFPLPRTKYCVFQYSVTLFYFLSVFTFSHFLCAYSMLSGMKYTFCFCCFALFSFVPH